MSNIEENNKKTNEISIEAKSKTNKYKIQEIKGKKKKKTQEKYENNQSKSVNNNTNINENENSEYDTVSLKEIREVIENKVSKSQKHHIAKKIIINIGIAIIMIIYLILIFMGSKNIEQSILEKDMKILCLCVLGIGIFILEKAYQKDSNEFAVNGVEVIAFSAANLCLVYIIKLYFHNLFHSITYICYGVIAYYMLKSIIMRKIYVRKYKKENNDIKDIVKK